MTILAGWNNGGSRLWSSEKKHRPLHKSEGDRFYRLSDKNMNEFEETDHHKSASGGHSSHNKYSGSGWEGDGWDGDRDAKQRAGGTIQRHTEGNYDHEQLVSQK